MKRRPKEIYDPGELLRVRRNLGSVTPEEAREAARLLGGEVGVERSDAPPARGNADLQAPRVIQNGWINRPPRVETETRRDQKTQERSTVPSRARSLHYLRMLFRAAFPPHRLIPVIAALFAVFLPFSRTEKQLRAQFVRDLKEYLLRPIETIVLAARRLRHYLEAESFDRTVLDLFASWDLEFIRREISAYDFSGRGIPIIAFLPLLRVVYRPIVAFRHAGSGTAHLVLHRAFDLAKKDSETAPSSIEHLTSLVMVADSALNDLFDRIAPRLYPLLMLAVSPVHRSYDDLFLHDWTAICAFVRLQPNEILLPDGTAVTRNSAGRDAGTLSEDGVVSEDEDANPSAAPETPTDPTEERVPSTIKEHPEATDPLIVVMGAASGLTARGVATTIVGGPSNQLSMGRLFAGLKLLSPGLHTVQCREGFSLHFELSDLLLEWYYTVSDGGRFAADSTGYPPVVSANALGEKLQSVASLFAAAGDELVLNRATAYTFPDVGLSDHPVDVAVPIPFRSNGTLLLVASQILTAAARLFERVAGDVRELGIPLREAALREYESIWAGWSPEPETDGGDEPLFPIDG